MKKLLVSLFLLSFVLAAAGIGFMYYIRPDIDLTLDCRPVPVKERAIEMAKRLSLDLILSEEDVGNVLKKSLAANPRRGKDIVVRGANFTLSGDRLAADLSVLWKEKIAAGIRVTYRLAWKDPDLIAVVESVSMKDIRLPRTWAEDLSIPVGTMLPKPLRIQDVEFAGRGMIVHFRKPSLKDLASLAG